MASAVEGAKDALFFFGTNGFQANPCGNGTSYKCIVPPVQRAGLLAQLWCHDPLSTSNQTPSLSDAIEFCVGL